MAVTFRQWVDSFDSETEETGCTVTADPPSLSALLSVSIASAADTADRATANITAAGKLPAVEEGRARFTFTPASGFDLSNNSTIFLVANTTGPIVDLYLNADQKVCAFTGAGTLGIEEPNEVSAQVLAGGTEYTIEVAWKANAYRRVWVDGTLVLEYTLFSGAHSAVPTDVRVGIDHYDGSATSGWSAGYRLFQLDDDADVALSDPGAIYAKTGAFLASARTTGTDSFLPAETGIVRSATRAIAMDTLEAAETGAVAAATWAAAADVFEAAHAGTLAPAAELAGADAFEAAETGELFAAGALAGVGPESGTTHAKIGAVAATSLAAGDDTFGASRVGALITPARAAGADAWSAIRTGILSAGARLFGSRAAGEVQGCISLDTRAAAVIQLDTRAAANMDIETRIGC